MNPRRQPPAEEYMKSTEQAYWFGNPDYQRFLAKNLIRSLGYDNAVEACRRNHWDSLLPLIHNENARPQFH